MSFSTYCISCSEVSDVVSIHDDMSFDGCLWIYSSIAALLHHYFGVKMEDLGVSYAMCSACLGKLIQYCSLRDQIVARLKIVPGKEESANQEDNMEAEYLDDAFESSDPERDTIDASAEIFIKNLLSRIKQSSEEHFLHKTLKAEKMHLINEINSMSDYKIKIDGETTNDAEEIDDIRTDTEIKLSDDKQKKAIKESPLYKKHKEEVNTKSLQAKKMQLIYEINSMSDYKIKIDDETTNYSEEQTDIWTDTEITFSDDKEGIFFDNKQKHNIEKPKHFTKRNNESGNEIIEKDFQFLLQNCKDFSLFSWFKSKLKCGVCKQYFANSNEFKLHALKHTYKDLSKVCPSGKFFLSPVLKVDISSMKCRHCEKRVKELDTFRSHLSLSHNIQVENLLKQILPFRLNGDEVKCGVCNKEFWNITSLNMHMNEHTTNYRCPKCGRYFVTSKRLRSHIRNAHTTRKFKCTQCDETFKSSDKRANHSTHVHGQRRHLCPKCPDTFKSYTHKLRHLSDAHNEELRRYKCEQCLTRFISSAALSKHIRKVHLKERNCFCLACGKSFFNDFQLKDHMLKHTGERKYQCDTCGRKISRKRNLMQHVKLHDK